MRPGCKPFQLFSEVKADLAFLDLMYSAAAAMMTMARSLLLFPLPASCTRMCKGHSERGITAHPFLTTAWLEKSAVPTESSGAPEMRRQGFRGFSEAARHPEGPHPFRSTPLIPLIYRPVDGNSEGNKCITRYLSVSEADGIKSIHPTIHPIPPPRIFTFISESPISP